MERNRRLEANIPGGYRANFYVVRNCPRPCMHRRSLHSLTAGDIPSGMDQIKSPTRYVC